MIKEPNAVVTERKEVSSELIILRIAPVGWELPDFEPGQYVALGLPPSVPRVPTADAEPEKLADNRLILRAFSVASSSFDKEYVEIYANLVRSGAFTPRLFSLEQGDRLWMNTRFKGMFTLSQVPEDQDVVLVATSTGLAPYMSMLRSSLDCGGFRCFAVLLGARRSGDLAYHEEVSRLAASCPNLTYLPTITRPDEEDSPWDGHIGRVQDLWRSSALASHWKRPPSPETTHIFLCGNPDMISEMLVELRQLGFREHTRSSPGQIHIEQFW